MYIPQNIQPQVIALQAVMFFYSNVFVVSWRESYNFVHRRVGLPVCYPAAALVYQHLSQLVDYKSPPTRPAK